MKDVLIGGLVGFIVIQVFGWSAYWLGILAAVVIMGLCKLATL